MKARHAGIAMLTLSLAAGAGCARITTSVVEKPRVDQELAGGNRGYLMGSGPASPVRKSTRQMLQTDIELATARELTPWRRAHAEPPAAKAPATTPSVNPAVAPSFESPDEEDLSVSSERSVSVAATPYTVQSGETLEKIAAKVYGDANQWRRIYNANRDKLSSPNRIYPGQELAIPPAEEAASGGRTEGLDIK